jgi:hypothetical protein
MESINRKCRHGAIRVRLQRRVNSMVDENRARFRDAVIDKGIRRTEIRRSDRAPSVRGDAPLNENPHSAVLSVPPARVEQTSASGARGPAVGNTSTMPTPLATGRIGPNAAAELPKLGDAQRAGIREFLERK